VKPENILFADGHAVLADFGVARAICTLVPRLPWTSSPTPVCRGKPEYMSPEQASGETTSTTRATCTAWRVSCTKC